MSDVLKILDRDFPFIPTNKDTNYLICKEFKEVFLGVLEIECHGNKLIAESVGDGFVRLDVEFDGKLYETHFQLKKGDEDAIIFSLKNLGDGKRIYKEEVEVVKSIVKEEALPDPEPLIDSYEVVEEAKIDIEKYKTDAIKVINENFSNKKQKIEQLQESLTNLIDERLSELSSITANEVSNLKEDIVKSVNESLNKSRIDRDKTLVEINSIKDDVSSTAEFWSNILISNAKEKAEQLQSLKESVAFEIDTKITELKSELKSQESHITEAYDSIQSFINKTKRELLEEKTSSYANLEQLQKQANLVVSENLKKADLLVGKKITQLQSTADKKIEEVVGLVEGRIAYFDNKVADIELAAQRAESTLNESVQKAINQLELEYKDRYYKLQLEAKEQIDEVASTKSSLSQITEKEVSKLSDKVKDFNDVILSAEAKIKEKVENSISKLDEQTSKVVDFKSEISSLAESKLSLIDTKSKILQDAIETAEKQISESVEIIFAKIKEESTLQNEQVYKGRLELVSLSETALDNIKSKSNELIESIEKKVRDVTLVAVKKEDLAQLKKQLEARLDNESTNLKKYVAGYGGGGSVAQQFAAGGIINGSLNIASGQILSGGQDLFGLLGGGGGGGGSGIDTGVRALTGNWQNTYTNFSIQSANNASVYSTVNANSALWTASFVNVNADNYVITSADRGKTLTDVYSTNTTICVPNNTSYPFAIGDAVTIVQDNKNASNYTVISAGDGVTIYSYNSSLSLAGNYAGATLIKKGTNDWYLFGNLK